VKPYGKGILEGTGSYWLAQAGQGLPARLGTLMSEKDILKPGQLLAGKRGLVMGVANDRSIA
jgi:enoyl-[acyl-carrier protein] reductase I